MVDLWNGAELWKKCDAFADLMLQTVIIFDPIPTNDSHQQPHYNAILEIYPSQILHDGQCSMPGPISAKSCCLHCQNTNALNN